MASKKFGVRLSSKERQQLASIVSKGKTAAKTILKTRILLKADQGEGGEGWSDKRICEALDTNITMVSRLRERLVSEGFAAVLARKQRERPPVEPAFTRQVGCPQPRE